MTALVTYEICCDTPGCHTPGQRGPSAAIARERGYAQGWVHQYRLGRMVDKCPTHKLALRRRTGEKGRCPLCKREDIPLNTDGSLRSHLPPVKEGRPRFRRRCGSGLRRMPEAA